MKKEIKYYNIKVNLSEEDLFELQSGKEFNWNWNTEEDDNVIIKLNLFQGEEEQMITDRGKIWLTIIILSIWIWYEIINFFIQGAN